MNKAFSILSVICTGLILGGWLFLGWHPGDLYLKLILGLFFANQIISFFEEGR